jgi:hypothetical protein
VTGPIRTAAHKESAGESLTAMSGNHLVESLSPPRTICGAAFDGWGYRNIRRRSEIGCATCRPAWKDAA